MSGGIIYFQFQFLCVWNQFADLATATESFSHGSALIQQSAQQVTSANKE